MATPNYGYEKRQKELAKKQKKEEKLKLKAERKRTGPGEDSPAEAGTPQTGADAPAAGDAGQS